jgi:hypothetical protein
MGICGSNDFGNKVDKQEAYVRRELREMGGTSGPWRNVGGRNRYNPYQLRGKLRQEYHGKSTNDFIAKKNWDLMRHK